MKKGVIFYLDDEKELLEFVRFVLERNEYEVITAEKWDESYIKKLENVDMIILDIMFPSDEYDGYQVCKKIKSTKALEAIPVYMFSAKAFIEDKEESKQVGADGFIEKPIPIEELVNLIDSVIKETKK